MSEADYKRGRDHERLDVIDFLQYPPGPLPDYWKTCVAELLVALKGGRHVGSAKRLYGEDEERLPRPTNGPAMTKTYQTHELKTWPVFFDAVKRGDKTFEVRKNDRGFQRGDRLVLRKYDPVLGDYRDSIGKRVDADQAETVILKVTYVLPGMGIKNGYVCMGIELVLAEEHSSEDP